MTDEEIMKAIEDKIAEAWKNSPPITENEVVKEEPKPDNELLTMLSDQLKQSQQLNQLLALSVTAKKAEPEPTTDDILSEMLGDL